jgi:hypothetical protein
MGSACSSNKAPSSSSSSEDRPAELSQNEVNELSSQTSQKQERQSQSQSQPAVTPPPPAGREKKPSVARFAVINKNERKSSQSSSLEPLNDSQRSNPQQLPQTPHCERSEQQQQLQPQQERSSFRVDWSMECLNRFGGRRYFFREFLDYYNQFRYNCGMFVNNGYVQFLIIFLISVNALMMGIGTFDFVTDNPRVQANFELVDFIFLILFTIELGLQFIYHGWRLILDGWLIFDLVIIVTSWSFSSVQIIRAFRIFRALRLVTRVKIMKNLILGKSQSVYYIPRKDNDVEYYRSKRDIPNILPIASLPLLLPSSSLWCHAPNGCHWFNVVLDILYLCSHVYTTFQRSIFARPDRL